MITAAEHEAATSHLIAIITDLVMEHCTVSDGLDSKAQPANAAAMRELAKREIIVIVRDNGPDIMGYWSKPEPEL